VDEKGSCLHNFERLASLSNDLQMTGRTEKVTKLQSVTMIDGQLMNVPLNKGRVSLLHGLHQTKFQLSGIC
jgi:hypothetical protein